MKNTRHQILKLSEGDEKAFDMIFMAYYPRLCVFISGIIADDNEAENLAQDIFYRLWHGREKLKEVTNLNAYIYQMAKNAALNHIERNTLFSQFLDKYNFKGLYEYRDEEADEILIASQMQELISRTIDNMPPQRKAIFRMSRIDGKTNEEIARQLSISKRTVETHISAALSQLRKNIADCEKIN